ncbi:MAG TPA: hypothetical protein VFW19_18655 [Allosphingosinicella sp.]|nr:hypothetical protein [Allosphingosinicella sp.]
MPLLIAAVLAGIAVPHRPPSHEVARSRIAACGIAPSRIRFVYEPDLQEDTVRIGNGPAPSHAGLSCLARASLSNVYDIYFDDQSTAKAYQPVNQAVQAAFSRDMDRQWLHSHALLARLPRFTTDGESVTMFARRLEGYCGVAPGSMLFQLRPNLLTLRREWIEHTIRSGRSSERPFLCVMHGVGMSGLEEHGVEFGFVGNEAVSDVPER